MTAMLSRPARMRLLLGKKMMTTRTWTVRWWTSWLRRCAAQPTRLHRLVENSEFLFRDQVLAIKHGRGASSATRHRETLPSCEARCSCTASCVYSPALRGRNFFCLLRRRRVVEAARAQTAETEELRKTMGQRRKAAAQAHSRRGGACRSRAMPRTATRPRTSAPTATQARHPGHNQP